MAGTKNSVDYGLAARRRTVSVAALVCFAFVVFQGGFVMEASAAETSPGHTAKATFGGGCFWCTEAVYAQIKGVQSVTSGYTGGRIANPNYKQVCSGLTGHAEAVEIEYNPAVVPFEKLLEIFFATHDPTTLNRQGADVGTQYRSAIFYHDDKQKETAERVIASLDAANVFPSPIVTTLEKAVVFYPAEDYHQDYFAINGYQPYCQAVIAPKVEKVRKVFEELLKDE
jgi:peptide-methionine (S)-S-oxide reductase